MYYSKQQLKQIILRNADHLKLTSIIQKITVNHLGRGENNLNYLVIVNDNKKFVIRIPAKKEIEKNIQKEFDSLSLLPNGFGPKPIHFDKSKNIIPISYMIQSFIPGKVSTNWTDQQLILHAKKLAQLHKKKYSYWGTVYKKYTVPLDVYKKTLLLIDDYKRKNPGVLKATQVQKIVPLYKKYIRKNNHYMKNLKSFSLIHSDPHLSNTLFHKKQVRYVDWEWLNIEDNAQDVCQIYYPDMADKPWRMKLNGKRLALYLNTYLKYNPDKTLKERILIWQTIIKFTDFMYYKWLMLNFDKSTSALPKKHYQDAMKKLYTTLFAFLTKEFNK